MASNPITSWQIGKKMETVTGFIFLGSNITVDSDCSHEIKKQIKSKQTNKNTWPWKKSCDKTRQHIKSIDITLLTRPIESKLWLFQ